MFHKLTFWSILPCLGLFLVFLTLKLTHVIDWSWWLITIPLWPAACGLVVVGLGVISLIWIGNRRR